MRELTVFYFLFFRTAQQHAKKHFPGNVECKTIHSLAFEKVGSRLVYEGVIFTYLSLLTALCVCFCGLKLICLGRHGHVAVKLINQTVETIFLACWHCFFLS